MLASGEAHGPAGTAMAGMSVRTILGIGLLLAGLVDLAVIDAVLLPRWAQQNQSSISTPTAPALSAIVLTETRPAAIAPSANPPSTATEISETELPSILFASGSSTLSASARQILAELATRLARDSARQVTIGGHTDDIGSESINRSLSVERARRCRDFLASRGVAAKRMQVQGFGSRNPIDSDATAAARARNRRVEIALR